MGFFSKLFGRGAPPAAAPPAAELCPHVALAPKWDSVSDIGHEDRATGYTCQGCGRTFTADEARELRRTEAERLRHSMEP